MRSFLCENLCSESFPDLDRKFIKCRDSWNKRDARRSGDSEIELLTDPVIRNIFYPIRKPRWTFSGWCSFCRSRTQECFRQRLGDERARSNFGLKISFGMKHREREVHSEKLHSKIGGQRTRGGKSGRIMVKASRHQFIANLPVKLLMQWFGRCAIQPDHFKSEYRMSTALVLNIWRRMF